MVYNYESKVWLTHKESFKSSLAEIWTVIYIAKKDPLQILEPAALS